ncbi:hypothetical protein ABID22_002823 [Pontibacter aydingkolensis]|uniref:Uncharacterized protein n=1 Tax=Pontibacter aydingkolensis TaxID=1911536 RepID=A0ABS7CX78_9BACT|nr:hypothetical protein [Pontibacter aydingkolensis]MBW7468412.1 hypothetical protein [Pontibacter aydingkolensis]
MTQEQFYYCLKWILELREKILETYASRRNAQAKEATQANEQQVDFDSLRRFAANKAGEDKNTAEAQARIKELAAQEAKIREFVPVSLYGTRIEAKHTGLQSLFVVLEADRIDIIKSVE